MLHEVPSVHLNGGILLEVGNSRWRAVFPGFYVHVLNSRYFRMKYSMWELKVLSLKPHDRLDHRARIY